MRYLLLLCLLAVAPAVSAQRNLTTASREILREGQALYHLERASWVSTDLLQASHFPTRQVMAYFSYTTLDSVRTLFVGGPADKPRVLAEYCFPMAAIAPSTGVRRGPRNLTSAERKLLSVRLKSMADLQRIPGVSLPPNATFNAIVLPKGKQTWVYVLTATTQPGQFLVGNDYLLRYNTSGRLLARQQLHSGAVLLGSQSQTAPVRSTLHFHRADTTPFMTPTDICTLLLYHDRLPGKNHLVLGEKYVSIFSFADTKLTIITRQEFEKSGQK
ncbi:hypothetical protein [Hymenobacter persicinus]|uniref:Uncharacterized protein n=1 Tax=Hymenobacter persicinus TaxID=2025506 RepID=A0A4Q5LEV8_9BACT|nr:hypothetical protein [Hymenobacter persicinus]RYU81297.1 hypothetical protein EWM57_06895 [Hymenobacter persicinus]